MIDLPAFSSPLQPLERLFPPFCFEDNFEDEHLSSEAPRQGNNH